LASLLINLPLVTTFWCVQVIACHDFAEDVEGKRCSNRAIAVARTLPLATADSLDASNITVRNHSTESRAFIAWDDPAKPNGLVLTYELELRNVDLADVSLLLPLRPITLPCIYFSFGR
jgi:insulin receptor